MLESGNFEFSFDFFFVHQQLSKLSIQTFWWYFSLHTSSHFQVLKWLLIELVIYAVPVFPIKVQEKVNAPKFSSSQPFCSLKTFQKMIFICFFFFLLITLPHLTELIVENFVIPLIAYLATSIDFMLRAQFRFSNYLFWFLARLRSYFSLYFWIEQTDYKQTSCQLAS